MKAVVDGQIAIEEPSRDIYEYCRDNLVFSNPAYAKAENAGRSTWDIEEEVVLFKRIGNKVILPFGCLRDIWAWISGCSVNRTKSPRERISYGSRTNLYEYQETAVRKFLKVKNGILVAPCGSGKTQMGLEIASRIGGRTLWLTHTHDLLKQSMDRATACYALPQNAYGTITSGKVNVGSVITFATVQTMASIDLDDIRDYFDCVIVDECHHCVGTPTKITQFAKVIGSLSARYKIGLTATPSRADGLIRCMTALIGRIEHVVPQQAVASKTVPIIVSWRETHFSPSEEEAIMPDGTINFAGATTAVCKDADRNKLIAADVEKMDGATLILTQRVEHCEILCAMISGKKCVHLSAAQSKTAKLVRVDALRKLNAGEIDVVVATYQLAREGLDCPNLRNLVMACPVKERNTVVQSIGRVMRKAEGKPFGRVYDYIDDFGYFAHCARLRKAIYKRLE